MQIHNILLRVGRLLRFFESWEKRLLRFHSESMGSAIRDPLFSLLPSLKKFCRADISARTTSLVILLWENVKEHVVHTSPAVPLSSATNARSYGEMAFWREVPVFAPYRRREREGSDSDRGAETGEFLFYR